MAIHQNFLRDGTGNAFQSVANFRNVRQSEPFEGSIRTLHRVQQAGPRQIDESWPLTEGDLP